MNDKSNNGAAGLRGVRRVAAATVAVLAIASTALAQSPNPQDHKAHNHPASAPSAKSVADEIQELRGKVARLEAALQTGHQPGTPAMGTGAGMTSGTPSSRQPSPSV